MLGEHKKIREKNERAEILKHIVKYVDISHVFKMYLGYRRRTIGTQFQLTPSMCAGCVRGRQWRQWRPEERRNRLYKQCH